MKRIFTKDVLISYIINKTNDDYDGKVCVVSFILYMKESFYPI